MSARSRLLLSARRRALPVVAGVALVPVLLAGCGSGGGTVVKDGALKYDKSGIPTTEASTTAPPTTLPDAAGKPCVAQATPPAQGEPAVDVPLGPPPTKVTTKDLTVGDGAEVTSTDQTVSINYVGVACSTGVTFDSSYARGQAADFPLNQVVPGFGTGLQGMKVGGRRLVVIPPDQGYGAQGGPNIGPNETLVFVIDLLKVT